MAEHWRRFRWALRHPFTRTPTPVGGDKNPRHRLGIVDLPHAFTNLFVEAARSLEYRTGHRYMLAVVLASVLGLALIVTLALHGWSFLAFALTVGLALLLPWYAGLYHK